MLVAVSIKPRLIISLLTTPSSSEKKLKKIAYTRTHEMKFGIDVTV